MPTSLHCPNCGAPLHPGPNHTLTICIYCNSSVRIQPEEGRPQANVETALASEDMTRIKELLLAGRAAEAQQLYREKTSTSPDEAQQAVTNLRQQISFSIIRNQTLTTYGITLAALFTLLLMVSILAGLSGRLAGWLAFLLAGAAALQLWFFLPGLRTTLEFLPGKTARARILKTATIGSVKLRNQQVNTLKLLVEVQPENEPVFEAELLSAARQASLYKAQPGREIEVKYLPQNPSRLIFRKSLDAGDSTAGV